MRRRLAADRALGILLHPELVELHARARRYWSSRPISGSPMPVSSLIVSVAWISATRPGQHAEHTALGAGRHRARRRRLGIEAAVAGTAARIEDASPGRRSGRSSRARSACRAARRRRWSGSASGSCRCRRRSRRSRRGARARSPTSSRTACADDPHVGVHARAIRSRATSTFGRPTSRGAVEHLALQVRGVDAVEVDEPERADARGREVLRERAAEPARADQQHARVEQLALTLERRSRAATGDAGSGRTAPA